MATGRLLILDDDPAIGKMIGIVAEGMGLEARSRSRPTDFFLELDQWNPTHIAIDLIMPEMDGVEVMRLLANRNCRARIIITSGVGSRVLDAARRSAAERGLDVVGVVSKPFSLATVRDLLGETPGGVASHPVRRHAAGPGEIVVTETDLRNALERQEFWLAYQPKIHCATGAMAGFEALVRWNHPEAGLVMPDRFVALAETFGLIDALTDHIFDLGLRWLSLGLPTSELFLSVNISAKSLEDPNLVDRFANSCLLFSVDPRRVIFEMTESAAMDDPVTALGLLTRLRMKGFHLSIDDFGTGYSSMLQLVRLPFSEMKVDKSFVMTATQSPEARAVVKSVVDLGHSLGLTVVAEGVEDQPTLDFLNEIGCDLAQGYFIARPMPGDAVFSWIAGWEAKNGRAAT